MSLVSPLSAQGTEVGLKGGLSFGNISNKGLLPGTLKTRTGFAAGLYVGFGSSIMGIGAEGLYAQRGLRSDESLADSETRLDYSDRSTTDYAGVIGTGIRLGAATALGIGPSCCS
jgi:hypothetical protein